GAWFLWLLSAQEASSITKSSVPSPEVTVPFCLVPSAEFSQALWSTRPDHLCRFRVRFLCNCSLETFPGSMVSATSLYKYSLLSVLSIEHPGFAYDTCLQPSTWKTNARLT